MIFAKTFLRMYLEASIEATAPFPAFVRRTGAVPDQADPPGSADQMRCAVGATYDLQPASPPPCVEPERFNLIGYRSSGPARWLRSVHRRSASAGGRRRRCGRSVDAGCRRSLHRTCQNHCAAALEYQGQKADHDQQADKENDTYRAADELKHLKGSCISIDPSPIQGIALRHDILAWLSGRRRSCRSRHP